MVRPRDRDKERRILAGALSVVEREGLAALSMEAVANEARVAIGTLYVYFDGKEALLSELYVRTKSEFARAAFGATEASLPVRPAFERMSLAYLQYLRKHRGAMLFLKQAPSALELSRAARDQLSEATRPLVELLERAKSEGLFKPLSTPLMIAFLQTTLGELSSLEAGAARASRAERSRQIIRLAWDALKA